jgi:hypothetical protein
MEGAARDRLVAVRRCGGTPVRQMRRPEGPSLASIGPDRLFLGLPSVLHAASWLEKLSRCFWVLSGLPVQV